MTLLLLLWAPDWAGRERVERQAYRTLNNNLVRNTGRVNPTPHRRAPIGTVIVTTAILTAAATAALATLTGLGRAARGLPTALGARRGQIRPYAAGSPHFTDDAFHNTEPSHVLAPGEAVSMIPLLIRHRGAGKPAGPVPLVHTAPPAVAAELGVPWLGHATTLIEIDGHYVLTDPVWGERVSPSETIGPARLHAVPIDVAELPRLDAIVISHDHYDHLDLPTVRKLVGSQGAPFLVPIGIGAHLRGWGVPEDRIIELDWDEQATVGRLTLTCTESRHFSGRGLRRNTTLWCSWAITGPDHRVYFGGDTGYTQAFTGIGERYGPFDVTVLPIGAYGDQWPDIHLNPEEAVQAHRDLRGDLFVPIHWATFDLALHTWEEPVERLVTAGQGLRIAVPRPGQRIDVGQSPPPDGWWRTLGDPVAVRQPGAASAIRVTPAAS
jgi:L-ascorbate metabolism protein UlaG (beta-lactamase superfamily)